MKLSISVTNYSWAGGPAGIVGALRDVAQAVDQAGVDTLWVADHLLQMDPHAAVDEPMLEARPRVLVGGMGELRTLPLVARYADACNLFDGGVTLGRKLDALARSCDAAGRDVDDIEVTLSSRLGEGEAVEQFTQRCAGLAALGIDHTVLVTAGTWRHGGDLDVALEAVEPLAEL